MSLQKFKTLLEKAAVEEGIEPKQVTRRMFRKVAVGVFSDWAIKQVGGFLAAKNRVLGNTEPHPISKEAIEKAVGHEKSEFIRRVIEKAAGELEIAPHEITFSEFSRFCNMRYGVNDQGIAKYIIVKVGGFNNIRDAYFPPLPTAITVDKRRLQEQARMNRKLGSMYADRQFIFNELDTWAEKFKGVFTHGKTYHIPTIITGTKRALNLLISDTHFGSDLDPSEVGMAYGILQEARRLASVAKQAIEFYDKPQEIELNLWINGDIFNGSLHDLRDGAPVAEQMARSLWLLGQLVQLLSEHFLKVNVRFAVGNHGRNKQRHHGRAVNQKWDSLETAVYYAVKVGCASIKNVSFTLPKTPFVTGVVMGHQIFASHGDTVFSPGVPQKSVNMKELAYQASKFNIALRSLDVYTAFLFGHIHSTCFTDPVGVNFVINSCLIPSDSFAVSIGSPEVQCAQTLFESRESNAVFCLAPLRVGLRDDEDATLDRIIKPWSGL